MFSGDRALTDDTLRLCHAAGGIAFASETARMTPRPWLRGLRERGYNAVLAPSPVDAQARDEGAQAASPVLPSSPEDRIAADVADCAAEGLILYLDLTLDQRVPAGHAHAAASGPRSEEQACDPRRMPDRALSLDALPPDFTSVWRWRLRDWVLAAGAAGVFFRRPWRLPARFWHALLDPLRHAGGPPRWVAWGEGLIPVELQAYRHAGFDATVSSLSWWDFHAGWLDEEDRRLRAVGPVIATPPAVDDARAAWTAAFCGAGVMFDAGQDARLMDVPEALAWHGAARPAGGLHCLAGRDGRATLMTRESPSGAAWVLAVNPSPDRSACVDVSALAGILPPVEFRPCGPVANWRDGGGGLPAAGIVLLASQAGALARPTRPAAPTRLPDRGPMSRIAIERVSPSVDEGRWAVKRIAHERVRVAADIYMDGHDALAAELMWRDAGQPDWRRVPMTCLGNDRWTASFQPCQLGAHEFALRAWRDDWGTFRHNLTVKRDAGQDIAVDVEEGAALLRDAVERTRSQGAALPRAAALRRAVRLLTGPRGGRGVDAAAELLLSEGLRLAMDDLGPRVHETRSEPFPLWVDRNKAGFGSWYELFPRSQALVAGAHGTLRDVIARLPDIRDMGFDVLYLPPIHPIGLTHRKGRNNALRATPQDPGSPYAIGSAQGGHDAIEPALGGVADFSALLVAARAAGLEIALDFAAHCSPDHPWVRSHPEWFEWRADASLRHAENPPKKYEDIVNLAFYGPAPRHARRLSLWRALRDALMFWVELGVGIFRVDNPHTKPLPFWQWLIADVQARRPDVIFLSEAFTRPAMMRRLAKIGFTQSYTYFTWRNTKTELEAYFSELAAAPMADYFRPNFFVNTPDINPYFLQSSGRPGFLIRAALAATASGAWGIYSGFELCEAEALPGREEYLDSEKYQLRQRDWFQPGNIRAEIARLNQIRRAHPALHAHRGHLPVRTDHDSLLAYVRVTEGLANVVLVAVSLDPHAEVHARLQAPRALFGLADNAALAAEDLLDERTEWWGGDWISLRLDPRRPYRLWRLSRSG